ncbi:MAG: hypothetical protein ACLT98_05405 [Eggerthellaceae bacterium]
MKRGADQVAEELSWVRGDFATDETGHLTTHGVTADKKMRIKPGCGGKTCCATED